MAETRMKPDRVKPESYGPATPAIVKMLKRIVESGPELPAIEVYQAHREPYRFLGMEFLFNNRERNPDCPACWGKFSKAGGFAKIQPYRAENSLLGVFCQSDPGYYRYLIGAVVTGVDQVPEGMLLADFPSSDFLVVTHEWVRSEGEADRQIGRIVGFAHGEELRMPDGYEKYTDPIMFIEGYNYDFDGHQYRFEVWLPIKPIASSVTEE